MRKQLVTDLFLLTTTALHGQPLPLGKLLLQPCAQLPAYCGSLDRPLDPTGAVPGTIAIGFEYYPRTDLTQPALGTIVAVEGGPGYPSSGSRSGYLPLFAPLRERRNLLLVDNRGTGRSGAIDCQPLQKANTLTLQGIGQCGAQLGQRADLYGSGLAADDLSAVLMALATGPVDLYGDSYGTFFGQTFAARHPAQLRSVVLDSAYPAVGETPWYGYDAPTMRHAFNVVCQRAAACRDLPGASLDRIQALLEALRQAPATGFAFDGNGDRQQVTADASHLAYLMFSLGTGPVAYRELDPAARAYLAGDHLPLLRLIAENNTIADSRDPARNPKYYSVGLYAAVSCSDYPQIYDMTQPFAVRKQQRDRALTRKQKTFPGVYAPFTIDEFIQQPLDYSLLDFCLTWPVPSAAYPPGQPVPLGAEFTTAPTLVLSGELDSLTAPPDGKHVAALFPNGQQILVANSFHVTAVADRDNCAAKLVRTFIETLSPGDATCASQIAEVRTVPNFARTLRGIAPATAALGNQGTVEDLRKAAVATLAAGDVVARWWVNLTGSGVGLRGGQWSYSYRDNQYHFLLDHVAWVEGTTVSGTVDWNYGTGLVTAQLTFDGTADTLQLQWQDRQPQAVATLTGTIGGRPIAATMAAP